MTGKRRGRPAVITPELIAKGAALRELGHSWASCADVLGVTPDSVRKAMLRLGINPQTPQHKIRVPTAVGHRKSVATPELIARAQELRAQGVCWKLIERQLGVSYKALSSAIRRQNKANS